MLWSICIFAIFLLSLMVVRQRRHGSIHRQGQPVRCAPGNLPIVGNAIDLLKPRHSVLGWFVDCQRQFANESLKLQIPFLPPGVLVSDPRIVEYALKNEKLFVKGDFSRRRLWDLFGRGIINTDGQLWKTQRKAGLKFFAGDQLDTLIDNVLPSVYSRQTRITLQEHARSGRPVDLQTVLLNLTTSVVGRTAYDMDMDGNSPFSRAFDHASDQTSRRFQNPLYWLTEIFNGFEFRSSIKKVKTIGQEIVLNALQKQKSASSSTFGSLIDSLLDAFDNDTELTADSALNFLSAGRDTTAQSLTWTLYGLMRYPSVLADLRSEIDQLRARRSKISAADLQPASLPITMSIFNESLRLHPPVPFEIKQSVSETTLPDGTSLPANSVILWCIWAMNRAYETWGADADEFRPSRWLLGSVSEKGQGQGFSKLKLITKSAFEFPVFHGGPRACLGKKMAELMACWVLVVMVGEFDFEELPDLHPHGDGSKREKRMDEKSGLLPERRIQSSLTLPMEGGLPCRVRWRAGPSS